RGHGKAPRPPTLEVREAYLWDLAAPGGALTAVLRYTVGGGTASFFTVSLPEGLDLRSADVAQVGPAPEGAAAARLRGVQILGKGAKRQLRGELQGPAAGEVQLTLGLLTRGAVRPGGVRLALPLPARQGAKTLEGLLAYRVEGLDSLGRAPELGALPVEPETFVQAWQRLGMREPVRPTRAYGFNRSPPA